MFSLHKPKYTYPKYPVSSFIVAPVSLNFRKLQTNILLHQGSFKEGL